MIISSFPSNEKTALAGKQDKLTGTQGQVVGFDANGDAVAQAAPDTGVTTFNNRTGAVTPQAGDYTAAQVGAVPTTRKVNNKALSEDISLTASDVGAAATNHGTHVTFSSDAPKAAGTASAGSASSVARSDHVHPVQTTVSGNAGTATKLATARNLKVNLASESAASFNGTADVTIGVDGIVPVKHGGTGVDNLNDLKAALGLGISAATLGVSSVLNENSWANIKKVSDLGLAANCWSVGDTKEITINGTIGTTVINQSVKVFILGFDHNSEKEGTNRIHFQIGKDVSSNKQICFVDSTYDNYNSNNGSFTMNPASSSSTSTNTGGWKDSHMRKVILGSEGTPSEPTANTFLSALPSELRAAMKSVTKYTDNSGGGTNTASAITSTTDYLFLLSEYEVQGTRSYANSAEQNYQKRYDYYRAGNSRVFYKHNSTGNTARWWHRSPNATNTRLFCAVGTDGSAGYSTSGYSIGVAPAFCV